MVLTNTHYLCCEQKYEKKCQNFLFENFHFLVVKFSVYLSTHYLCFEQKYEKKCQNFLFENFHFLVVKCSVYLSRRAIVMYERGYEP